MVNTSEAHHMVKLYRTRVETSACCAAVVTQASARVKTKNNCRAQFSCKPSCTYMGSFIIRTHDRPESEYYTHKKQLGNFSTVYYSVMIQVYIHVHVARVTATNEETKIIIIYVPVYTLQPYYTSLYV